jgi:hypothetical protein
MSIHPSSEEPDVPESEAPSDEPTHVAEPQGTPQLPSEPPVYAPRPYLEALTPEHRAVLEEAGQLPAEE